MTLNIEATYENGVLKPNQPLSLQEHEKVQITINTEGSLAERTAGMVPWNGDHATLERLLAEADEPEAFS